MSTVINREPREKSQQSTESDALWLRHYPRHSSMLLQDVRTSLPLLTADGIAILLAACLSGLASELVLDDEVSLRTIIKRLSGTFPAFAIAFYLFGLYPGVGLKAVTEFRTITLVSMTVLLGLISAWIVSPANQSRLPVGTSLIFGAAALVLVPTFRTMVRSYCARFEWWSQPIMIVGFEESNRMILDAINSEPQAGFRPVRILCDSAPADLTSKGTREKDILDTMSGLSAHRAIISSDSPRLRQLSFPGAGVPHIYVVSNNLRELPFLWARATDNGSVTGIEINDYLLLRSHRATKRALDLLTILLAAPIVVPVVALLALAVKLSSPGPVFYSQKRLGWRGQHFDVWKLRTMVMDADQALEQYLNENPSMREEWDRDHKLKNDPRVTSIGSFLRKTSLDELPQLWNVIVGEMSLVGPRPIVDAEIPKYGDVYELYKQVIPGITGLWQVSGRNNTTYEERLKHDCYYVCNWSPWLDAFILMRTVKTVLLREGAY